MRLFKNLLFSAASISLTAGLVAYADPSVASTPRNPIPQVSVATRDIDMQTATGRKTLDQRIRRAAHEVCADNEAGGMMEGTECRTQAITGAYHDLETTTADAGTSATKVAVN